ncbi:carbohydrate sulfotransferase 11-like isoform X2 [Watersipora subatra]
MAGRKNNYKLFTTIVVTCGFLYFYVSLSSNLLAGSNQKSHSEYTFTESVPKTIEHTDTIEELPEAFEQLSEETLQLIINQKKIENSKRLAKIAWFCDAEKKLQSLPPTSHMYDIPGRNLSLSLIAKVASTSWVAFLARTEIPACIQYIESSHSGHADLHACVKEGLTVDQHEGHVRALFIRDPWTRLVSVYEDKIVKQRFVQADECYKRWRIVRKLPSNMTDDKAVPANLSFAQFIACIIETKDPNDLDPHYRPQYLMQGLCHEQYTQIGTLEDLNRDFLFTMKMAQPSLTAAQLGNLLKIFSRGPRRPWEVTNLTDKRLRTAHYFKSLTETSIQGLQNIYKWDVLLHSYRFRPLT